MTYTLHNLSFYRLLTLCVLMVCVVPTVTHGFLAATATVDGATFDAGVVSIDTDSLTLAATISTAAAGTDSLTVLDMGTITSQFALSAAPLACDSAFYNQLELEVVGAAVLYSGFIGNVAATSTAYDELDFTLSAGSGLQASSGETCSVAIVITAWQDTFTTPQYGFTDTKTIILTVTAVEAIGAQPTANVVLNEIYPSVLATTTQPLDREWIELYNGTAAPIDVAQWDIGEFIDGDTNNTERRHTIVGDCGSLPASMHMQPFGTTDTVIPAGGFLIVEFCGVAPYLSDAGDTVRLYNDTNQFVDSHTFGATVYGKSHARIPDGATWVDPIPTPGGKNIATQADLEAEGWAPELIEHTLALLHGSEMATDSTAGASASHTVSHVTTDAGIAIDQLAVQSTTSDWATTGTSSGMSTTSIASTTTVPLHVGVDETPASTTRMVAVTASSSQTELLDAVPQPPVASSTSDIQPDSPAGGQQVAASDVDGDGAADVIHTTTATATSDMVDEGDASDTDASSTDAGGDDGHIDEVQSGAGAEVDDDTTSVTNDSL